MMRKFAGIIFLAVFSCAAFGQSAAPQSSATTPGAAQSGATTSAAPPPAAFDIADVHGSPHRTFAFMDGGDLLGDRYSIRQATMVDLIVAAYGVQDDNVLGGPAWLETDRFDVIAKAPPATPKGTLKLMLQSLLADRFKLVVHADSKPVQAYVLSAGKDKPKLKESEASDGHCDPVDQNPPPAIPQIQLTCHGMTMEELANFLHDAAGGYLTSPVVDSTGLDGSWDFDIKWTPRGALPQAGDNAITIFDAVDKQLGLKLDLGKTLMPVIVVDRVNEKPSDNSPEVAKILPPPPPAQFDVAVIKPTAPDNTNLRLKIDGAQVSVQDATLKLLIEYAWDININGDDMLVGAPKWLDADHWDILAKVAVDAPANGKATPPQIQYEDLEEMFRSLLIDRFKLVAHMEVRPISAYTLMADKPKLTKGDPSVRTRCKEGPGPDGKDPRIANPVLNRLLSCQNMTMPEFADMLESLANGYIYAPVLDATGLEGGWDFTLSFSSINQLMPTPGQGAAAPPPGSGVASDPSGALSLIDAVRKQLGLKLEKQTRPAPALVIDHVEQKPTDN